MMPFHFLSDKGTSGAPGTNILQHRQYRFVHWKLRVSIKSGTDDCRIKATFKVDYATVQNLKILFHLC